MAELEGETKTGAVYTRTWVVRFMLDLAGYKPDVDLGGSTIVEPGCGDGEFLVEIVGRLLESSKAFGRKASELVDAVRAFDLDAGALKIARKRIVTLLKSHGVAPSDAAMLVHSWTLQSDFLLANLDAVRARWVVGNPPYIRVEDLDPSDYAKYRDQWTCMSGRADVYVGFFQAALSVLEPGGVLSFICADRWMHNQYGAGLRRLIIEDFAMDLLVELHDVDVFATRVAAYPAITLVRRGAHSRTAFVTAKSGFDAPATSRMQKWFLSSSANAESDEKYSGDWLQGAFSASESWPSGPPERLAMIAALEDRLPLLSATGVEFGVGMATGADKVYVTSAAVDVEPDRLRPAVGPSDLELGAIIWQGRSIVSPWEAGELVQLEDYPRLKRYFEENAGALKARYVALKNKESWWRTIDRPRSDEYADPKLIVADINDRIEPVLDTKGYWPLHSAYFIKSTTWDLSVLGGFLLSDVAAAFVEAYSVKMAGGHLRVSSQYLKKIRAPEFKDISPSDRTKLKAAFRKGDREAASVVARRIVGLS